CFRVAGISLCPTSPASAIVRNSYPSRSSAAWSSPAWTPGLSTLPQSLLLSDAVGEPHGESLGEAALADLRLRLLDRIRGSPERCPPHLFVNQQPGGTRIAAARLADRARIEEPPPVREVDLVVLGGHAAAELVAAPGEREGDVAVADDHERRRRQAEAQERRRLAEDVVPHRVDRAAVVELRARARRRRLERAQERERLRLDHLARPARGGGGVAVELVDGERAGDGEVVVAGEAERGALGDDRAAAIRARPVAHRVAETPDLVDALCVHRRP